MTPFPLNLAELLGPYGQYVVFLLIGFAFGYVLEIAGFGKSTKLAAQFYLKDMTVLKVMFTGIITAMALVFAASALGLLDYNLIWVNPTYLWPGIVGGLIMGFGFILGGFCPGTSIVGAATLKLDGIMFLLGVFFGIFLFGETVGFFDGFWNSSFMGRFTLPELLSLETGIVVLGVVVMALVAFWGAEKLEGIFGNKDQHKAPRWRFGVAGGFVLAGIALIVIGQPTLADRWNAVADERNAELEAREVQIHPGELLEIMEDNRLQVYMIDVRPEADYNLFHILDSNNIPLDTLEAELPNIRTKPAETVFVTISNDEEAATEAWKTMSAASIPNAYILSGGINRWIETFASDSFQATHQVDAGPDELAWGFPSALGSRYPAADPNPDVFNLEYEKKVKLEAKRGPTGGGCG